MIERARLKRRRLKYPVRYWTLTMLQCVVVFTLVFYYAAVTSRSAHVRIAYASVRGTHALSVDPFLSIARASLDTKVAHYIRRDNELLYPASEVRASLIAANPRVEDASVVVSKKEIILSIKEREPAFRYCVPPVARSSTTQELLVPTKGLSQLQATSSEESLSASSTEVDLRSKNLVTLSPPLVDSKTSSCYWVDATGFAFAKSPVYSGSPLLTFVEGDTAKFEGSASSTPSPVGSIVLDNDMLEYGTTLRSLLLKEGVVVYDYEIMPHGDIRVHSGLAYPFIVSMRRAAEDEVNMLVTALLQFTKNTTDAPKEYLDLRFVNKVYYK